MFVTPIEVPTPEERRKRQHDEMVDTILAIAREMMKADGVAALSFNAIARRLGMSAPSLYTYFDSKHAIYDTLFRRGFEQFSSRMETRPHQGGDPALDMQSAIETYMSFALENPDLFQLMFQRPVPGFVPSEQSMAVSLGALQRGQEDMRRALEHEGVETGLPIEKANDLLIAFMFGLTELHLANNPESPVGEGRFGGLVSDAVQLFMQAWTRKNKKRNKKKGK